MMSVIVTPIYAIGQWPGVSFVLRADMPAQRRLLRVIQLAHTDAAWRAAEQLRVCKQEEVGAA